MQRNVEELQREIDKEKSQSKIDEEVLLSIDEMQESIDNNLECKKEMQERMDKYLSLKEEIQVSINRDQQKIEELQREIDELQQEASPLNLENITTEQLNMQGHNR